MKIDLSEKSIAIVKQSIAAGTFATAEEVVTAALEQWVIDDTDFAPGEVEALIRPAIEQLERGEGIPHDEAMRRLDEYIAEQTEQRKRA